MLDTRAEVSSFWSRVNKNGSNGCWEWTGFTDEHGYGQIHLGKTMLAHRVSWAVHHSDIPKGLYVCHRCDNTKCVNPSHLFLGTAKDNHWDAVNKGRKLYAPPPKAKAFNEEQEAQLIKEIKSGVSQESLAQKYGVSRECVSIYARKNGIRRNFTKEEIKEMFEMHKSGSTYADIARTFEREQSSIRKAISRHVPS